MSSRAANVAGMARPRRRILFLSDEIIKPRRKAFPNNELWATRVVFSIRAIAQRVNDSATAWLTPYGLTFC